MKKITAILLIILVLFSAASCSSTIAEPSITASVLPTAVPTPIDTPSPTPSPTVTPSPTPIQYIYKDAVVLDLADVMEQASTAHRTRLETEINYDQLLEYIPNDPEAKALLTREEIKLLKEEREMKETLIPYDEAVADVELYFRTLKYAYALYYYFGGDEAFNAAQQEIMAYLEGKDGIYAEDLAQCIYDSLDFIRDVHNQISGRHYGENRQQRYEYHYSAEPHDFSADEHGFYKETVTGDSIAVNVLVEVFRQMMVIHDAFYPKPGKPKHLPKTDVHDPETRSYNMSQIRAKNTKPEEIVAKHLFRAGFRKYVRNDSSLPGKPDISLKQFHTVVFINGCFWHGHEGCRYFKWPKSNQEFWKDKINANRERDKRNLDELAAAGWHVITVWECDLKERRDETLDALVHEIRQQPHRIYKKKRSPDTE